MKITAVSAFVLLVALLAPIRAVLAEGPSFLGEWTATATTPAGDVSETLFVVNTDSGYAITAKPALSAPEGSPEVGSGTDIVLDGDKFSYKRSIITPEGTLVIAYAGVVSGDTFKGSAALGGFEVPYTGVRVKR